jgi:TRAP-type C4-dicarboxylate transport system permease small subunit
MRSFLKTLERGFDRLIVVFAWVAGGLMMFALAAVCVDVLMRYFFNRPLPWVLQISEYVLLYIPFLAAAYVLREESHIRIDILLNRMGRRKRNRVTAATSLLGCGVLLVLAYYGTLITVDYYRRNVPTIKYLKIPEFLVIAVIPLGCFLFALQFLRRAADHTPPQGGGRDPGPIAGQGTGE